MIPVDELAARVGAPDGSDAVLLSLRDMAVAWIERYTGYYLGEPAEVREFVGGGLQTIWLEDYPASDPALVVTDYIEPDDYALEGRRLISLAHWGWPAGFRNVEVVYWRGFAEDHDPLLDTPERRRFYLAMRGLVFSLVASFWRQEQDGGARIYKSETIGGYSYTLADAIAEGELPPGAMRTLALWKKVRA